MASEVIKAKNETCRKVLIFMRSTSMASEVTDVNKAAFLRISFMWLTSTASEVTEANYGTCLDLNFDYLLSTSTTSEVIEALNQTCLEVLLFNGDLHSL